MQDCLNRTINYMRISVTDSCNLRCRYCMPSNPSFLPSDSLLTFEELLRICRVSSGIGIRHFKITGGEPFVRPGLLPFLSELKNQDFNPQVTITTNGTLLTEETLHFLKEISIDGINISLDTLNRQRFCQITGSDSFPAVMQAIKTGCALGLPLKINTVLLPETKEEDIEKFLCLIKELPLALRFITRMDIGKNMDAPLKEDGRFSTFAQVVAFCEKKGLSLIPDSSRKGNGPASYFHIPGFAGCLGEIDAMHKKFCSSCNRIRLTADGNLKPCLYYSDSYPLKELLRKGCDDESLRARIWQAAYEKPSCHHFEKPVKGDAREKHFMNQIGG